MDYGKHCEVVNPRDFYWQISRQITGVEIRSDLAALKGLAYFLWSIGSGKDDFKF